MKRFPFLWVMLHAALASAGTLDMIIVPPSRPALAGRTAVFSVYVHNNGNETVRFAFPPQLACRINAGDREFERTARAASPLRESSIPIRGEGFAKMRYALDVPEEVEGPIRLAVATLDAAPVMFSVNRASQADPLVAAKGTEPEDYGDLKSLFSLYQPYLVNFSAYEPIYFLVGARPEESKFQISFKYQFFNDLNPLVDRHPWLKGVHLGYTQTSFWDLESDSAPFEDTSYKPELFFLTDNIQNRPSWMKGLFFQTGLQHESNGRGGGLSRSTNFLYFRPVFIHYDEATRYGFLIAPKVWAYVNNDEDTNPDIEDYRGFFDVELKAGRADHFVLGSNIRWADEGPSIQLDLTYPLDQYFFRNLDIFFHLQYVNALAEDLLEYRERSEAFRMGFSIVR